MPLPNEPTMRHSTSKLLPLTGGSQVKEPCIQLFQYKVVVSWAEYKDESPGFKSFLEALNSLS